MRMWNEANEPRLPRSPLALVAVAGVAVLGSAELLAAGRALAHFTGTVQTNGQQGVLLLAVTGGILLLALAAKALLPPRRPHPAGRSPRRR
jgi:hypothetical protein